MLGSMTRGIIAVFATIGLLLAGCAHNPLNPRRPVGSPAAIVAVPTALILDASGSMTEADAPGPRIAAAKTAAHALTDALPDDADLALLTYGTGTGSADADKPAGCLDVTTLIPLGPLDRDRTGGAIDAITAAGYTPISLALRTAADQLPADDSAQAIVLVSDGEDTCEVPPCETAATLKHQRPNLTISTVGFRIDGAAVDQLRCIADATGGLFVQAANADQLVTRLLATQNLDEATRSLSSTGMFGLSLGDPIAAIHDKYPDFPAVPPRGAVLVQWRDCDFGFVDGILDGIRPHDGGRTIDGVTVGTPIGTAIDLYGAPLSTAPNAHLTTVFLDAGPGTDAAYRIDVADYGQSAGGYTGTVQTITLCRCKPRPQPPPADVAQLVRAMTFPAGTCGNGSRGWSQTAPITVRDGDGEAITASGEFGGASIRDAKLVGWVDPAGTGTHDAVVSFICFGSTFAMCCAGRSSMMEFIRVFDFADPQAPRPIGETIMPGESPIRGKSYGEARRIDQIRVDGSTIITEETLIYADTSGATAALDHAPDATIEVTHRYTDGRWVSTERVLR